MIVMNGARIVFVRRFVREALRKTSRVWLTSDTFAVPPASRCRDLVPRAASGRAKGSAPCRARAIPCFARRFRRSAQICAMTQEHDGRQERAQNRRLSTYEEVKKPAEINGVFPSSSMGDHRALHGGSGSNILISDIQLGHPLQPNGSIGTRRMQSLTLKAIAVARLLSARFGSRHGRSACEVSRFRGGPFGERRAFRAEQKDR